jgi:peroxiredoxin Q/BCP
LLHSQEIPAMEQPPMAKKTTDETPSEMIGKPAPAFALPDQDGKVHKLSDYEGKHVVLYWYPKDDTPGCTKESCGFRDNSAEFAKLGAVVLGASMLDVKSKAKFAKKHALNFPLLADEDNAVATAYGVWKEKSMYGKTYMGISRETFLIGPDGKIAMHWPKASGSEEHPVEVLEWLKANG